MKLILAFLFSLASVYCFSQNWSIYNGGEIPFLVGSDSIFEGQAVYINTTNKLVYRANLAGAKKEAIGFASKTAAPGDTTYVVTGGLVLSWPNALIKGSVYYLSTTPGEIQATQTSSVWQAVGVAVDTYQMQVVVAPVRVVQDVTPGLSEVTAIDATTYNGIQFKGTTGDEGHVNLYVDPVAAVYDVKLPQANGTIALTTDIPGLNDVTAVEATSYNDIVISDGVFPVLTLHGTDSAYIKFVDPVEENDLTLHPPSAITSTWHQYLPNKNGTIAVTTDITDTSPTNELQTVSNTSDGTSHTITLSGGGGSTQFVEGSGITLTTSGTTADGVITIAASGGGGSGDIVNGGNTTAATVVIGTNDANALSFETNNVVRQTITGGASTGGAQTFTDVTANTNTVENTITINTNSTGTAATGFGAALLTKLESSTTDNQDASAIKTYWTNATHASREAAISFFLGDNGGALAEAFKFDRAAQSSGALSIGTSGASVYYNGGITPGSSFQIGGNTNGISILSSANSATNGIIIANNSGLSSSVGAISIGGGAAFSTTSNTRNYMNFDYSFSPTSGTAVHNSLVFSGTINQTGGANGIVRRVYDNTTTTSVADYRSLEIAVNTANAKGIYQTGASTSNNLVGKTAFGSTTAPTSSLTVTGANGYTQFRLVTQYTPTGTDDANGSEGDVAVDNDYIYFKTASGWKRTALSTF